MMDVMDMIITWVQKGFINTVPLIVLLGLLIFVHELGHFLVAIYYGVRVEVFSLGFGKKIFRRKKGDTEYCISLIPFGGYVKMYGDDPTADIPQENRSFSFVHKPVGQRIAVVLAGPLMNFFFAILLFGLVAMLGEDYAKPQIGDVDPKSPAYTAGFRSGDTVLSIGGETIQTWDEFKKAVEQTREGQLTLAVQRYQSEETATLSVRTRLVPNRDILSLDETVGEIEGVAQVGRAAAVGISDPKSLAAVSGLRSLDQIVAVNGTPTPRWIDLERMVVAGLTTGSMRFDVERPGVNEEDKKSETLSVQISSETLKNLKTSEEVLAALGIETSEMYLSSIVPESAAMAAGLLRGDKVLSIGGKKTATWEELVSIVKGYQESQGPFDVELVRNGEQKTIKLAPRLISQTGPTGHEEKTYALGVMTAAVFAPPMPVTIRILNPITASVKGFKDSLVWTKTVALSFLRLIQNKVSARSLGGPIMIGQLATKTIQIGLSPFLKIMAIISINLFILNLLPVPVLDGGHLLFYTLEALRGAPMSMRKMEIAQQIGLVLLLGLMVFSLFNDFTRLLDLKF